MNRIPFDVISLFIFTGLIACRPNNIPANQIGDWAAESQLNGPTRSEAVSFVIDNFAYVGTGWDGLVTRYNDFWKYDPVGNSWSQVTSMPDSAARNSAVAFTANGKGYVGTGYDGFRYLSDFYQFDPATNAWTRKSDYPGGGSYEATAFGIDDFGYAGTGYDGTNALKDFYKYDPVKDEWTDIGFSGNKRYGAVAFVYNHTGYVLTGVNSGVMQSDFWKYDPDSLKWTELRHISNYSTDSYDDGYTTIERWNGSTFVEGNHAYMSTGENVGYNTNTWDYDITNDTWSLKTPFEGPPTTGAVGFSLTGINGGGGFIATGRSSPGQAGASDYLWQFYPNLGQNPNDN
jgi:N-acetylneuraminic acid mutarotase